MALIGSENNLGLFDTVAGKLDQMIPQEVPVDVMMGQESILNYVFANVHQLCNTPWWPKFIEFYSMKSSITLFTNLNLNFLDQLLKNPIPGILPNSNKDAGRRR